jgi:hypothetical protein
MFEGTEERSVTEGRTVGFNFLLNPNNVARTDSSLSVSADAIRLEFHFRFCCFKWCSNYRKVQCPSYQTFWIHKIHGDGNVAVSYWMTIFAVCLTRLDQCFSNCVPQSVSRGSERRQHVMAEEFYWLSETCTYELKFVRRHSTLFIPSLTAGNQTISRCFNPEAFQTVVKSVSTARHKQSRCVRRNDQLSDQFEQFLQKASSCAYINS